MLSPFKIHPVTAGLFTGTSISLLFAFYTINDPPAIVVSCDNLNVIYTGPGLENPLNILTRGIPSEEVIVTASGAGLILKKNGDAHYAATASSTATAEITVTDGGRFSQTFPFKVRPVPDPELRLGARYPSGDIEAETFKAQGGVTAVQNCCGFESKCSTEEYFVRRSGKKYEGIMIANKGARFEPTAQELINKAEPGNFYYFDDVKVRCPGDQNARVLGSLFFKIR